MRERATVDFPQPDSPTSPSVSPSPMSSDTSSTAFTWPVVREKKPPVMGKYFLRERMLINGLIAIPLNVRRTTNMRFGVIMNQWHLFLEIVAGNGA